MAAQSTSRSTVRLSLDYHTTLIATLTIGFTTMITLSNKTSLSDTSPGSHLCRYSDLCLASRDSLDPEGKIVPQDCALGWQPGEPVKCLGAWIPLGYRPHSRRSSIETTLEVVWSEDHPMKDKPH